MNWLLARMLCLNTACPNVQLVKEQPLMAMPSKSQTLKVQLLNRQAVQAAVGRTVGLPSQAGLRPSARDRGSG